MFVGMLLLYGGLCLEFMMFANIVVTFVDSFVLFEFLGWIKHHLKKKVNGIELGGESERQRANEENREGKKEMRTEHFICPY